MKALHIKRAHIYYVLLSQCSAVLAQDSDRLDRAHVSDYSTSTREVWRQHLSCTQLKSYHRVQRQHAAMMQHWHRIWLKERSAGKFDDCTTSGFLPYTFVAM